MSLIPYTSRDSREIVLRHKDAIVVRDPQTRQLILRGATNPTSPPSFDDPNCPTCHRPLRSSSHDRSPSPNRQTPLATHYISPEYFRMLQAANGGVDEDHDPPSSPIRRLTQPAFQADGVHESVTGSVSEAEFVGSTPAPQGVGIKRKAFSPNYFKTFFVEEKELGRGGKGVVLLVRHVLDGVNLGQFACKRVPVGDDHLWLEKVLIEVQLLQGLSHPNLVSYRHVWLEDHKINRFSPSIPCAFILQQYCNSGDLLQYIVGQAPRPPSTKEMLKEQLRRRSRGHSEKPTVHHLRKLAFEEIYSFFKDITSGLAHLHASNYIHRDLKPSNCLLHKDGNEFKCLISDFGEVQAENVIRKSTGTTGTISYCAPEVLKADENGRYGNFTAKSDIFSLGMILFFMCFGRLPYSAADTVHEELENVDLLREEISGWSGYQEERRERPDLPVQLYHFLKRLLAIDPAERPTANEILAALRTDKGLDNPPRSRNGSSSSLSGRIIQSIDSPMPPGTPVMEPMKTRNPQSRVDHDRSRTPSPHSSPSQKLILENIPRFPNHSHPSPKMLPSMKTPLLMPPPASIWAKCKHQTSLYQHYTRAWVAVNSSALLSICRLLIFAAKIASMTRPCGSYAPKPSIWWPLVAIAALDLSYGHRNRWRISVGLTLLHVIFLTWSLEFSATGLCVRGRLRGDFHHDWHATDS